MSDSYPVAGNSYQPKSADDRAIIMSSTVDPVTTVMEELSAILLDANTQRWLTQQGSVPTTLILPWLQELYARGSADNYQGDSA